MIERTFDAEYINGLVNHPSIFPWVSFPNQTEIDLTQYVADPRNFVVKTDGGAFFFEHLKDGVYEAHSMFLPGARGAGALNAAREAIALIFKRPACGTILARCPQGNLAVLAFTRALKFEFLNDELGAWPTPSGPVKVKWFQMTRSRWAALQETETCQ